MLVSVEGFEPSLAEPTVLQTAPNSLLRIHARNVVAHMVEPYPAYRLG